MIIKEQIGEGEFQISIATYSHWYNDQCNLTEPVAPITIIGDQEITWRQSDTYTDNYKIIVGKLHIVTV